MSSWMQKYKNSDLIWFGTSLAYQKKSHTTESFPAAKQLFEVVWKCCPLVTIREYFFQIDQQISAYQQGYNGPQSQVLMKKYKSHCCIPQHAAMSIDMLTSWIMFSLACLAFFLSSSAPYVFSSVFICSIFIFLLLK
jgi:hypothetical protein